MLIFVLHTFEPPAAKNLPRINYVYLELVLFFSKWGSRDRKLSKPAGKTDPEADPFVSCLTPPVGLQKLKSRIPGDVLIRDHLSKDPVELPMPVA